MVSMLLCFFDIILLFLSFIHLFQLSFIFSIFSLKILILLPKIINHIQSNELIIIIIINYIVKQYFRKIMQVHYYMYTNRSHVYWNFE